jgi:heme/copper-type cytochrome/quinol oxidase subunit 3
MVQAERPTYAAGVSMIRFGTIVFLASELLLFIGLFAAYFGLRSQTSPWPPDGIEPNALLAGLGTATLMVSNYTLGRGLARGEAGRMPALRFWTGVTFLLGVSFLSFELWDWTHVPFAISTHPYGTMYFTLTGIHALHVLAGLLVLAVLVGRSLQGAYASGNLDGARAMAYYWQFCDATWILIFLVVFILR